MNMPTREEIAIPALRALKETGGEASIEEHAATVATVMKLPEEVLAVPHGSQLRADDDGKVRSSEFNYQLTWVRTYLREMGAIERRRRGVWLLTDHGWNLDEETAINEFREVFRARK